MLWERQAKITKGGFLKQICFTHVALIPKTQSPQDMSQIRPISLCNVLYKIAAKVLTNRLKPMMDSIISPFQSAFVPGRLISDNSLVAAEVAHHLHGKRGGNLGSMAVKLDMSKAYDRVEWSFLRAMMLRLGLNLQWVDMIMRCVTSVSYSFLINGVPTGLVVPSRGLRQGDPLSPYLFLMCVEGLSALISSRERDGLIHGVKICRNAPSIHHLLFVDDSFIFARASRDECSQVMKILRSYELASGQVVNLLKSSVVFSKNVKEHTRAVLSNILGVLCVSVHEKYLGLPTFVGRAKRMVFASLKEKLWNKLKGWKGKLLSGAGREILIKAVAQSLPTYTMNCFLLPKGFCDDLNSAVAKFWWSGDKDKRKIHWLPWKKLCNFKLEGGLNFRELRAFNLALLAKQGWRLCQHPNSLVARLFRAKYYPGSDFLLAPEGNNPSFCWRSIFAAKQVLERGMRWQVGNGSSIRVWFDKWIPRLPSFQVLSPPPHDSFRNLRVDALLEADGNWNFRLLHDLFPVGEVEAISSIPLSFRKPQDRRIWHHEPNGCFTVRSAYGVARDWLISGEMALPQPTAAVVETDKKFWSAIWHAKIPPKIKICAWRVAWDIIPTRVRLYHRKVDIGTDCVRCISSEESSLHLFVQCPFATAVWSASPLGPKLSRLRASSMSDWLKAASILLSKQSFALALMLIWALWKDRNSRIWECVGTSPTVLVSQASSWLQEFHSLLLGQSPSVPHQPIHRWIAPRDGFAKVNVGGVWLAADRCGGIGVVIRNESGSVLAACSKKLRNIGSLDHLHAVSLLAGIRLAEELNLQRVCFECGSAKLAIAVSQDTSVASSGGVLFDDCCVLLSHFQSSSVANVPRLCNRVANRLALFAFHLHQDCFWFGEAPELVQELLTQDVCPS
ncbi:hypothetical protein CerSpe_004410 [Prunus speciosa]